MTMPQDGEPTNPQLPSHLALPDTRTWHTPEVLAERKADAEPFRLVGGGLESMYELGYAVLKPQGRRILIRSVLVEDANPLSAGIEINSRKSVVQKVLALGAGCAKWYDEMGIPEDERLKPGDYVWVLSTVMDRLAMLDKTIRLNTCDVQYAACKVDVTEKARLEVLEREKVTTTAG